HKTFKEKAYAGKVREKQGIIEHNIVLYILMAVSSLIKIG
ncbi:MAG: hypothetical protein K0Q47_1131, partial [Sedimentibacter sp.]|nr:hypothetical protein [Sedimentibacter sp.]